MMKFTWLIYFFIDFLFLSFSISFVVFKHSPITFFSVFSKTIFLLFARCAAKRETDKKNKEKKYRKKSTETLSSRLDWKHEVEHGTAVCRKPNIWYQINEKCFAARFQKRYSKVWPTTRLSTVQVELSQRKWKSFFLLLSN